MEEIARWPLATLVVLTLFTVAFVIQLEREFQLKPMEVAFIIAGQLCGLLGFKAVWLLFAYSRWKGRFPGSYLVATFIAFIPTFGFYSSGLYLLSREAAKPLSLAEMIAFLMFSYVLFSLFFGACFRFFEWMLLGRRREQTTDNNPGLPETRTSKNA
jgi:hypothetical protein